ncbi:MAG: hypothetical protein HYX78_04030 [Armatimonadetes bacterium]|nr:hypothetical protein [Armatimonadota bacterium]
MMRKKLSAIGYQPSAVIYHPRRRTGTCGMLRQAQHEARRETGRAIGSNL